MDNFRLPAARGHKRTPVSIDVTVNGILNFVDGRITDLSEGGARVDGASMPARSRCEIHYGGQVTYAVVMWAEHDRMGVRFPYELAQGGDDRARANLPQQPPAGIRTPRIELTFDPPCREAMGRWQPVGLTEGPWRHRCRPSTIRCADGPPPHRFATGRIGQPGRVPLLSLA